MELIKSLDKVVQANSFNNKKYHIKLLSEFAICVKDYILHPTVDKIMKLRFNKKLHHRKELAEQDNLNHEGKITALLVAQNKSKEIQLSESIKLNESSVNNKSEANKYISNAAIGLSASLNVTSGAAPVTTSDNVADSTSYSAAAIASDATHTVTSDTTTPGTSNSATTATSDASIVTDASTVTSDAVTTVTSNDEITVIISDATITSYNAAATGAISDSVTDTAITSYVAAVDTSDTATATTSNITSATLLKKKREGRGIGNNKVKVPRTNASHVDFASLEFELVDEQERYIVNELDVSQKFYEFQLSIKNRTSKLFAESHVHQILAISSILLLKPGKMNHELINLFGTDNIDMVVNDIKKVLGIDDDYLPMDLISKIAKIIEDVKKKIIARNEAAVLLLSLEKTITTNHFKVIKSIVNILFKVPLVRIMDTIKENELSTRYLDPLLSGLFDDPDPGIFFRWTNERPNELKYNDTELSDERPDAVISSLLGTKWLQ